MPFSTQKSSDDLEHLKNVTPFPRRITESFFKLAEWKQGPEGVSDFVAQGHTHKPLTQKTAFPSPSFCRGSVLPIPEQFSL